MPKQKREINKIVPYQFYNLAELVRMGRKRLFPYSQETLLKDFINKGKLRAIVGKRGTKSSYRIKGSWILEFIENYEKGNFVD